MLALLLLLVIIGILFSIPAVQTRLARTATNYINDEFGVNINIEKIDLSTLGNAKIRGVLIKDHHQDTLIYADELLAEIANYKSFLSGNVRLRATLLKDAIFQMKTYKGEEDSNFDIFIEQFDSDSDEESDSDFILTSSELALQNGTFSIVDENNNSHVYFKDIAGKLEKFSIKGSDITAKIIALKFIENDRLTITDITSDFSYTKKAISLKDFHVKTKNKTNLKGTISFLSNNGSYSSFPDNVKTVSSLKGNLSLRDANLFYKELSPKDKFKIYTEASGTLNNLFLKKFSAYRDSQNHFRGNIHLKGLFDDDLLTDLDIKRAKILPSYLKKLLPNLVGQKLPKNWEEMEEPISTFGQVQISNNTIKAVSTIFNESLGKLSIDLKLTNTANIEKANYAGTISAFQLDLGKITQTSTLGKMTADLSVKGKGFSKDILRTSTVGIIRQIKYNDYTYKNIALNGLVKNNEFDGALNINDPNLKLNFKGLVDFSKKPYIADFKSNIRHSDLNRLNFFTRDSIANLKGEIQLQTKGSSLDDFEGNINFKNLSFTNPKGKYLFKDFKISSTFVDSLRVISINSPEIISGMIKGKYRVDELGKLAENALASIYANFQPIEVSPNQYVDFNFKIYNKVIEILYPDIELAPNTLLKGKIVSDENKFKLSIKSPQLKYKKNKIQKINIQVDNKNPLFNAQVRIDSIKTGFYDISKFKLVNVTLNDTLFFTSEFKGGKRAKEKYDFSFFHTLSDNETSVFGMLKSMVKIKDRTWFFNENSNKRNKITYQRNTGNFVVDSIGISSKNQKIAIAGKGNNASKKIDFNFNNIDLSDILPSIDSLDMKGIINGKATYAQKDKETRPEANLTIKDFEINRVPQGDAKVLISAQKSGIYNVDISLQNEGDNPTFTAKGNLDFSGKKSKIDVDLEFLAFNISPFSPLAGEVLQRIRGDAYGTLQISESPQSPNIDGDLYLDEAGLYIPILNVDYDLEGTSVIAFKKQSFKFVDVQAKETQKGTMGDLFGTISHKNFSDWFFDLSISTKNLLVLNTEETDSSLYYGTAFLDGVATIKGPLNQLKIGVNGKTNKGTEFIVPISSVKTAESSDIIRFVDKNKNKNYIQTRWQKLGDKIGGLSLEFNLELTKDATFKMILDKSSGSYLKGSGTGNVQVSLDTKDKFDMYGYVIVDKGIYDFRYGIISKPFIVEKGGIIKFNGDPLDAEIDISAVHKVTANPKTLLEVGTSKRIPINLITRFSGALFDTKRDFDIEFPNLSSSVASELEFKIQNDKTQQFISLLVLNSFFLTGNRSVNSSALIYGTGATDLIANAFDNLLNKDYSNFSLRPTYRVGEKGNVEGIDINDQLGIELDYKINDRIIVNGKVGVPVGTKNSSNVIGEGNIDFLLNEEGSFRLSVFNRQNEIQYTEEEQGYTQGVGLNYYIDFNTGKELLEKLGVLKKKDTVKNMLNKPSEKAILEKKRKFQARNLKTKNKDKNGK